MNSRIAACAVAAITMLGLTACSAGPSVTTATPAPSTAAAAEPTAAAPSALAEEPGTDQAVTEACLGLAAPMVEASVAMQKIATIGSDDPQSAVDSWTALVNAFQKFAKSAANPKVKAAATRVYKDIRALRDAMQKLYVEEDLTAMTDFTKANTAFQTSYTALNKLCAG